MDIKIAREVTARIWHDRDMSSIVMDEGIAEQIAQLLATSREIRPGDHPRVRLTVLGGLCTGLLLGVGFMVIMLAVRFIGG